MVKNKQVFKFKLFKNYLNIVFFYKKAIWKIIKALLPAKAIEFVKFCDKLSIKNFISEENLFKHMSGTDTYTYTYTNKNSILNIKN
jgi:hypothetical protein